MDEKRRSRRDFFQNVIIALLLLSAVFLFAGTQRSTLGNDDGFLSFFSDTPMQSSSTTLTQTSAVSFPVRVAVTGAFGRYGSVSMTTTHDDFEGLSRLLSNALGTAQSFSVCNSQEFLAALKSTSVYFDFLSPLPLSVLMENTNHAIPDSISARQLIISVRNNAVQLYLWDDFNRYMVASTALSTYDLDQAISRYELGNAQFALDLIQSNANARSIAPCSLFLAETPTLSALASTTPSLDNSRLLTALEFNPNTKFRYTESTGTEVIEENSRTLRIHADGNIHYQSGGADALTISAAGEQPTLSEAAAGASALLNTLLGPSAEEAALYIQQIQQSDNTLLLTFGYHINGIPVRFSDGSDAASVTLSGRVVTDLTLQIRQYKSNGSQSLLLPLSQALAIACRYPGAELFIGYADNGSNTANASWLID